MPLTPGENDRLLLHLQASLAQRRRDRGLRLNVPEARALIADAVCEWARDGLTWAQARDLAGSLLTPEDVLPGVPGALSEVRVEGRFRRVLVRSVPAQDPPYRPYLEVCASQEVRWEHHDFEGVFVGFRFPNLEGGATIGGLHLHGMDTGRTTGGHNHELHIEDAELLLAGMAFTEMASTELPFFEMVQWTSEFISAELRQLWSDDLWRERAGGR